MTDRTEYLLQEICCASMRAGLIQADINAVGLSLKHGLITAEQAIEHLHDCGLLQFIEPTSPTQKAPA